MSIFIYLYRCDCNGHAETCDTSTTPYTCQCSTESYTQGPQCSTCQPLYNNKAFKVGDQVNPYNCRPCNCSGHADSCVYNVSIDPFPDSHDRFVYRVCYWYILSTSLVEARNCIS